jgi:hypothetical protein
MVRWFLFAGWLGFVGYALWLAPGERGGSDPIFIDLIQMRNQEPSLMVMFSLLGIFPMAYACLLLRSDRLRVPAWPFVLGSFGLGAFALLPYFIWSAFSTKHYSGAIDRPVRTSSRILRLLSNRLLLGALLCGTVALMGYGLLAGDRSIYVESFQQSQFVHVMTIDFVVLTALSIYAISLDASKRAVSRSWRWVGLLPIIGIFTYLWLTRTTEQNDK